MIDTLMKHRRKAGKIKIDSLISKNSKDYQVIDNSLIYSKNNFPDFDNSREINQMWMINLHLRQ